jgi:hypothetical protein
MERAACRADCIQRRVLCDLRLVESARRHAGKQERIILFWMLYARPLLNRVERALLYSAMASKFQ